MSLLSPFPKEVYRKDPEHQYFDGSGRRFLSVSKLIEEHCKGFDAKAMSYHSARKAMNLAGRSITTATLEIEAVKLQKQWSDYGEERADVGTEFHDAMESYVGYGKIAMPQYESQIRRLAAVFSEYYATYCEVVVYSKSSGVAGTVDNISLHSAKSKIVHVKDYKTNEKGIKNEYKYNGWMYAPIDHLVDNKFIKYALQQSLYGLMLEEMGYKIATLSLLWIDLKAMQNDELVFWKELPVPYMKYEAKMLLDKASITNYFN